MYFLWNTCHICGGLNILSVETLMLHCQTYPHIHLKSTNLVGVHNIIPVPVPPLTHGLYPCGFPYPWQSLSLKLMISYFTQTLLLLSFANDTINEGEEEEDLEALLECYHSGVLPWPLPKEQEEHPLTPEAECQFCLPSIDDWSLWHVKGQISHGLSGYLFQVLTNSISMVPRKKQFFPSLKQQKDDMKCMQPSGVLSTNGSTSKQL